MEGRKRGKERRGLTSGYAVSHAGNEVHFYRQYNNNANIVDETLRNAISILLGLAVRLTRSYVESS